MKQLTEAVTSRNVVLVVGTGVSAAITNSAATATWLGLIRSCHDRVVSLDPSLAESWSQAFEAMLSFAVDSGETNELIRAAAMARSRLEAIGPQAVARWLEDAVGSLPVVNAAPAQAVLDLGFPVLTTNYDTLLEQVGQRTSAAWTDPPGLQRVLSGESNAVGHLHGIWNAPDSVVFSDTDYQRLSESAATQALQQAASSIKSMVYIGFGDGLNDPNFGRLLDWHRATFEVSGVRHFRLCLEYQVEKLTQHHRADNIIPVAYGNSHDDLVPFLHSLATAVDSAAKTSAGIVRDVVADARQHLEEMIRSELVIADEAESSSLLDLVLPPVLLPVPHAEYVKARSSDADVDRIQRLDPLEEAASHRYLLLVSEEGHGLTTALQFLALCAADHHQGAIPIYVDFRSCGRGLGPLNNATRAAARAAGVPVDKTSPLPPHIIAVDDVNPFVGRISERVVGELSTTEAKLTLVGCKTGHEVQLMEQMTSVGIAPRVVYLGRLESEDVTRLAQIAAPTRAKELASTIVDLLNAERLPRTPFTVSLLVSVLLHSTGVTSSASQTAVLEQYVSLLLGRGDPHEDARYTIDQLDREVLLTHLAERFVREEVRMLPETVVVAALDDVFSRFGWVESPTSVLAGFVDRRVLKRQSDGIEFARPSFLYLFAAKRAQANEDFRSFLFERPLYFAPILLPYAALARSDASLLRLAADLLTATTEVPIDPGSPFGIMPLAEPIEPSHEVESEEESSADAPESTALQPLLDLPERPLFATEDEMSLTSKLSRSLELASVVLRDTDQAEDLELKQSLLSDVLGAWGTLISALHADRSMHELIDRVLDELDPTQFEDLPDLSREDFRAELLRTVPATVALAGIERHLATRKLVGALNAAITDGRVTDSDERTISAVFFEYALADTGWAGRVRELVKRRGNMWLARNFILWLCLARLASGEVSREDEGSLVELCVEIIGRSTRYDSNAQKKRHLDEVRRKVKGLSVIQSRKPVPGNP